MVSHKFNAYVFPPIFIIFETNTTYYYKAVLKDGTEFSNILTAKTLEGGEIVVNPNTGIGQQLLLILVTLITSGVVYLLIKNKSISLN